jgi:hypothetical protein
VADENRLWGAERIRGELPKLGIRVAKRTIQRYLHAVRRPNSPRGQSWIRQRIPVPTSRAVCDDTAEVVAIPSLEGLHHDDQVAA